MPTTINDPDFDPSWSVVHKIHQSPPVDVTKPYSTSSLAGKSILITGGASGFGAAFARHWASHGSHVFIGDVNDAAGQELVAELRSRHPGSAHAYFRCDVTVWSDQVSLFRSAVKASPTGGIDCVVAGAGIVDAASSFDSPKRAGRRGGTSDDDDDDLGEPVQPSLKVIDVNFTGVMYTAHLALYYLPRNGPGTRDRHVLLVSSVAGVMPLPSQTEYTASKHAVMGMFRAMRGTSWLKGVRVNVINPYFVETPLLPHGSKVLLAGAPKAQLADVVDAATRLVADESVVGRALMIGPKMRVVDGEDGLPVLAEAEEEEDDLESSEAAANQKGSSRTQAVWEIYGHDYEKVETFVWRYLTMLSVVTSAYGWWKTAKDWWRIFFSGSGGGSKGGDKQKRN